MMNMQYYARDSYGSNVLTFQMSSPSSFLIIIHRTLSNSMNSNALQNEIRRPDLPVLFLQCIQPDGSSKFGPVQCISSVTLFVNTTGQYLATYTVADGHTNEFHGQMLVYLCLWDWPDAAESITIRYTLTLDELSVIHKEKCSFSLHESSTRWDPKLVSLQDIQDVDTMTFRVEFELFQITWKEDTDDGNATNTVKSPSPSRPRSLTLLQLRTRTASCCWSIDDDTLLDQIRTAPKVYAFGSPIFELLGYHWYIGLCPNGSRVSRDGMINLFLALASASNGQTRVDLKIRFLMGDYCREILGRQGHLYR